MHRRTTILLALSVLACAAASAPAQVPPAPASPAHADPRAVTFERMLKPVTIDLADVRLEDAVEFLRVVTNAPLEVHWLDASRPGLDPDAPVTISASGSSALSILQRILDKAGDEFDAATWQMTPEGVMEVGPRSVLNRRATLIVYDVRDLTFPIPDYKDVPELNLNAAVRQTGGGGGGGIFQQLGQQRSDVDTRAETQRIAEILQQNIEFDQWRDHGGEGASLTIYDGSLLVRAPDYIHRQIAGYAWWPASR